MIDNSPELAARAQIFRDKVLVPGRSSSLRVLPAVPTSLEGLQYTTAFLDEAAWASNEVFETLLDALGKYERGRLIMLGTPSPFTERPLGRLREQARQNPDDPTVAWIEHSADEFQNHEWSCEHCLALGNPALGQFLHVNGVAASRPPKTTESRYRMMRLGQWVSGGAETYLDRASWAACANEGLSILPGADVVLAFDGSRSGDSCVLVAVSVEPVPVVQLVRIWQPHIEAQGYRVPIAEVEQAIRDAADLFNVREIVADSYLWERSLQLLAEEGYRVSIFPNSNNRMIPALAAFKDAVHGAAIRHNGNQILATHVENARIKETDRGNTVEKSKYNRKIDALICSVMAYERSRYLLAEKPKTKRLYVF